MLRKPFCLVVLLCLVIGCARQARITVDIEAHSKLPPPIVKKLASIDNIRTVKAYAGAELQFRGTKKVFDVAMVAKLPDMIRLDFIDTLAGVFASVASTPDSVVYVDSGGVYYHRGLDGAEAFKKVTNLPWTPEEFVRVFLGGIPERVPLDALFPVDSKGRFWVVADKGAVWEDASSGKLTYLELKGGRVLARAEFGGYLKQGAVHFPMEVDITSPRAVLKLNYRDVDINPSIDPEVFRKIRY